VEQFAPQGMLEEELQLTEPEGPSPIKGDLIVSNIGLADEDGVRSLEGISFDAPVNTHIAIVGDGGSGKSDLGSVLARLVSQTSGTITIGGADISNLPEAVTGRRMGYVGPSAYLQAFSVGDNLLYGLKHRPVGDAVEDREDLPKDRHQEARLTGNSEDDYHADWVDLEEAGATDRESLNQQLIEMLKLSDLEDDVYRFGLRGVINPEEQPEVAARIMSARSALRERLTDPAVSQLIEPFDAEKYNTNATVAENILFGLPVGDVFDIEKLAEHPYIREILDKVGLSDDFLEMGKQVAQTMLELFADLPPGHEFFDQFSFIDSDDLPEFQMILGRAARGPDGLTDEDRLRLISLPFKLIPARHRLDLINEQMMQRILEARRAFAEGLAEDLRESVAFFDVETYNAAASVQDNILFGKLSYGQAQAENKVGSLVSQIVDELELRETVILAGLEFQVGIGGARMSPGQRQKIAIARNLLRRPELLILNEATASLDPASQSWIMGHVLKFCEGKGVIWVLNRVSDAQQFDKIVVLKSGRVLETGTFEELSKAGGEFQTMLDAD
ncbi:MAG: ATP-binding cassette domain-containing protein, partial [Rhodospirillaceae bacterium]|nr:ATP-binding cassette domain-containing protein [Rhodospirillaceae bacterium]